LKKKKKKKKTQNNKQETTNNTTLVEMATAFADKATFKVNVVGEEMHGLCKDENWFKREKFLNTPNWDALRILALQLRDDHPPPNGRALALDGNDRASHDSNATQRGQTTVHPLRTAPALWTPWP
jgi:hypothetical protein